MESVNVNIKCHKNCILGVTSPGSSLFHDLLPFRVYSMEEIGVHCTARWALDLHGMYVSSIEKKRLRCVAHTPQS